MFLQVIDIKHITDSTYVLRFERNNITFRAGQYICLGVENYPYMREYSIYSGENEDFLEVLIKEVDQGDISVKLKNCQKGDRLRYKLPQGKFLSPEEISHSNTVFIATGTGVSPFHSFVKSNPQQAYTLIHGIRNIEEAYGIDDFDKKHCITCTSQEKTGTYVGRVTEYLRQNGFDIHSNFFLCGNGKMIYEVFDILQQQGVKAEQVNYEIYF